MATMKMMPYGVKKNWNVWEDSVRDGRAYRQETHRKVVKLLHRRERRVTRAALRKNRGF